MLTGKDTTNLLYNGIRYQTQHKKKHFNIIAVALAKKIKQNAASKV